MEENIASIRERMILNQMPQIGDLRARKQSKAEIKKNIQAFQALLSWKESQGIEMRQGYQEKLRKITYERDNIENKCQKLEERVIALDKKKYQLELKAREMEDKTKIEARTSLKQIRGG